ncbi:hypothetical protein NDU88_001463 [Pleurodeles waltl]|uniref:Uncharacterized protein n=1 Tax=Pleurodeles waltl TaxID=8319 RepID=A0AAV7M8A1_PLEWA|nr:hypothetical protein NDU88_001463 [Pleurodeles waltl]
MQTHTATILQVIKDSKQSLETQLAAMASKVGLLQDDHRKLTDRVKETEEQIEKTISKVADPIKKCKELELGLQQGPTWQTHSNRALPQDPVYPVVALCIGVALGAKLHSAAAEARATEDAVWDRRQGPESDDSPSAPLRHEEKGDCPASEQRGQAAGR